MLFTTVINTFNTIRTQLSTRLNLTSDCWRLTHVVTFAGARVSALQFYRHDAAARYKLSLCVYLSQVEFYIETVERI